MAGLAASGRLKKELNEWYNLEMSGINLYAVIDPLSVISLCQMNGRIDPISNGIRDRLIRDKRSKSNWLAALSRTDCRDLDRYNELAEGSESHFLQ